MKTLKFKTLLVTFVAAITLSSCLSDNDVTDYPHYSSYVTVGGDGMFGYTFYADFGATLIPTTESIQEVIPGLTNSDVKRMYISFDLVPDSDNGKTLEAGNTYRIALKAAYGSNIPLPTYTTIDIAGNQTAADSLTTKNQPINTIDNKIWAINGYVNAAMTIDYDYNKSFYMNTYYNHETDVDLENETLYLNLYYNSNTSYANQQGNSVFSFELPKQAAYQFNTNGLNNNDSINLVLRAMTNQSSQMMEVGKCKMAVKDFYVPGSGF